MKIPFLVLAAVCVLPVCGADEAFVLVDGSTGKRTVENAARVATRFAPCSTFKIPNSAIALESGVVPDEMLRLEYDP